MQITVGLIKELLQMKNDEEFYSTRKMFNDEIEKEFMICNLAYINRMAYSGLEDIQVVKDEFGN